MSDIEVKCFIQAFLNFIQNEIKKKKFTSDDVECLEVAGQCLKACFDFPSDGSEKNLENHPMAAVDLFELFQNSFNASPEQKLVAEKIKNEGNVFLREGKQQEALMAYNRAITLDATNPVFYCNRAAAYTRLGYYQRAVDDCKMSLRYNPTYAKAYVRLGLAYWKLKKCQMALEAYEKAINLDPGNVDYRNNMSVTIQEMEEANAANTNAAPNTSSALANVGSLDLSIVISGPAFGNLAQRFMANPTINEMISSFDYTSQMGTIFDTGEQVISQLRNEHPEFLASLLEQMSRAGQPNAGDGNNPEGDGAPSNEPQQPPQ